MKSYNGWVKLYRQLEKKGYYKNSQYVHLWVHLLLNINYEPSEFLFNNEIIRLKAGQKVFGRKKLSEETGIPESTIERILTCFENEHQIGQQKTNKFRIITIKNWKNYQIKNLSEQQNGQQMDNTITSNGQHVDTEKNNKNINNNKEKKKKKISFKIKKKLVAIN